MGRQPTSAEARHFADEFRVARGAVLKDAEDFDKVIHSVERLGSFLLGQVDSLGGYGRMISGQALRSPLASEIPEQLPEFHASFERLYELVKDARNDAMHQGAFARRLAEHAVQLSLVLEDALRRGYEMEKVGEFMVRGPICGEIWHPTSFIRQSMLTNAFSYLPVKKDGVWYLVADLDVASYLAKAASKTDRKTRLAAKLSDVPDIRLKVAKRCTAEASLDEAFEKFGDDPSPLLVERNQPDSTEIIGILAPFDLL
jgi:hypothetical protein